MRSMMRSTAEAKGRDPKIAEAMVDQDVYVPNVSDSGKVLTFTTSEAIANGFCERQVENINEIFEFNNIIEYEIIKQELTAVDNIRKFLISPMISGLLIMIIIGGLYFELQSPGVGFPIIASIIAASLFFAPLYLEGLASYWEIIVFIIGVILLAVEVFAIPGFGITGISGIILVIVSLAFGMVESEGFKITTGDYTPLAKSFSIVLFSMFLGLVSSFYLAKKLLQTKFLEHLALKTEETSETGYTAANNNYRDLVGNEALAVTILRPSGKVEINGDYYDAIAENGYIDKDTKVVSTKYENMQFFVRKIS
jgi:membrane-bound serine protease (ClpP class)